MNDVATLAAETEPAGQAWWCTIKSNGTPLARFTVETESAVDPKIPAVVLGKAPEGADLLLAAHEHRIQPVPRDHVEEVSWQRNLLRFGDGSGLAGMPVELGDRFLGDELYGYGLRALVDALAAKELDMNDARVCRPLDAGRGVFPHSAMATGEEQRADACAARSHAETMAFVQGYRSDIEPEGAGVLAEPSICSPSRTT
jgi:hypothetical protein